MADLKEVRILVSFQLLVGIGLLVVAALINPWFLESYIVLDGTIERKWPIAIVELVVLAIAIGFIVIGRKQVPRPESSRKQLFAAIALSFAFAFSLVVGEVFLRFFVSPELILEGEKWYEHRWRARQVVVDEQPVDWRYDYDRFDPLYGWLPKLNYATPAVTTNSLGIRGSREYAFERSPGVDRIVLIGDSFTWGEKTWARDIPDNEIFASLLEQRLPNTESINLGVHGWGTDQQLIYLRELGLRFKPDLVVLGFFEANSMRNGLNFFAYSKPQFELVDGRLELTNTPILDEPEQLESPFELPGFYVGALIKKGLNTVLDRTKFRPIEERDEWKLTRAIFEAAKRESEAAGAEFLLVDIPFGVRRRATPIENAAAAWAKTTGTHFVSLREQFVQLPYAEWAKVNDGHFTAMGHDKTAQALMRYIEEASLLPGVNR
ncbi:MAG: hypothetical protein ACI8W3_002686 [Myxococcota bacterium]|jgi:hypothetical protein